MSGKNFYRKKRKSLFPEKVTPKRDIELLEAEGKRARKKWNTNKFNIALAYPNTYHVGMSNLGFQTVYDQLNSKENLVCERVFLPTLPPNDPFKNKPPIRSFESATPLGNFQLLAFSVSFEMDYVGVLEIIDRGGVTLFQKDRGELPLVLMGGICAFTNPEPLASFIDGFFIGDAEVVLDNIIELLLTSFLEGISKQKLLTLLSKQKGFYVPSLLEHNSSGKSRKLEIMRVSDLSEKPLYSKILTPYTEFGNNCLVEITRGCPRRCLFCIVGNHSFHVQSLENIREISSKSQKIGLVGAAISDHPQFRKLLDLFGEEEIIFTIASIRADQVDDYLAKALEKSKCKTVSMAPEVGSERLIKNLGKNITEEHVKNAIKVLTGFGILNFRLYFMIGLPREEQADIEELADYVKRIHKFYTQECRKQGYIGSITLSINSFVPKPFTPFQWASMEREASLKTKIAFLKKEWRKIPNFKVQFNSIRESIQQAFLSLGGREVDSFLLTFYKNKRNWQKTSKEFSAHIDKVVFREKQQDEIFPWDFLASDKDALWKRYCCFF